MPKGDRQNQPRSSTRNGQQALINVAVVETKIDDLKQWIQDVVIGNMKTIQDDVRNVAESSARTTERLDQHLSDSSNRRSNYDRYIKEIDDLKRRADDDKEKATFQKGINAGIQQTRTNDRKFVLAIGGALVIIAGLLNQIVPLVIKLANEVL